MTSNHDSSSVPSPARGLPKRVHIFGGGTITHIANHLALCAPAYGSTAKHIHKLMRHHPLERHLEMTKMTGWEGATMVTNQDVLARVEQLVADRQTKMIFFSTAMCDFRHPSGTPYGPRPKSRDEKGDPARITMNFQAANKVIETIRERRKDIFLVGFKSTGNVSEREMYLEGLALCKRASCNLVLVNDRHSHLNMVVTPEEAAYHVTKNREEALKGLCEMAWLRSQLTFTRSTVVAGNPVGWNDNRIPHSLRCVVNHCIASKAYKAFNGATVGHFAVKLADDTFLTSIRRSNFNDLDKNGMVLVKTDGPDTVLAYGAKPSVGGQSQRIVFHDHPSADCIVHFHCPLREFPADDIPVRSQREVECGSMQCGENTSKGLKRFGNLKAVMLDQHGPNIVFPNDINPVEVIEFIERNFDLTKKTGGYQLPV